MLEPGQHVICINDKFHPGIAKLYTQLPRKDREYVIRDVRLGIQPGTRAGAVSVLLVGLINPKADSKAQLERGFDQDRFRPVDPESIDEKFVEKFDKELIKKMHGAATPCDKPAL
jgi:hypothetical protein